MLKIGIHADLIARFPDADAEAIRAWLKVWTRERDYLKREITRNNRRDLDGNDVGLISKATGSTRGRPPASPPENEIAAELLPRRRA